MRPMLRFIILILILLPNASFADAKCAALINDLRGEIESSEITLLPLKAGHKKILLKIFEEKDIQRFYLGGEPALLAFKDHLRRSKKEHGSTREYFDGHWLIE